MFNKISQKTDYTTQFLTKSIQNVRKSLETLTINNTFAASVLLNGITMKRIATLLLSSLLLTITVFANPIDPEKAGEIANNFWNSKVQHANTEHLIMHSPTKMAKAGSRINIQESNPQYYIYAPDNNKGFVIVSGDDALAPVIGYSTEYTGENSEMPAALVEWLNEYSMYVDDVRAGKAAPAERAAKAGKTAVAPMLQTSWDQSAPYNNLCPEVNGQKTPTGCTATAMAQIMKFHEWPITPIKAISWTSNITGKKETIDLTKRTYNWDNMLPHYRNGYTAAQAQEVAQLMVDVGKAINSSYSPEGTGSNEIYALNGFVNVFNYSKAARVIKRTDVTEDEYVTAIRENLEARQPVMSVGFGINFEGGHAYVFDGIDENDMIHIDWGWNGAYNGYFDMTYMSPDGIGTGGGTGTYNVGQAIIVNIAPSGESDVNSENVGLVEFGIYKPDTDNEKVYTYTSKYSGNAAKFKVSTFITNRSHSNTQLEFALAVKKGDGTFQHLNYGALNGDLQPGYYTKGYFDFTVDVVNKNYYNYLEKGTYELKLLYKNAGGEYVEIISDQNCLMLDVNETSATLRHALPDIHVSSVELTTPNPRIGSTIKFNARFMNKNTHNSTVVVAPIINTIRPDGSVISDTLKKATKLFEVIDNRDIFVEFSTSNQFLEIGDCYITFTYNKSTYYERTNTFNTSLAESVSGKSDTFAINEEDPEGSPAITAITASDITNGSILNVSATVTNQTYAGYTYSGDLALVLRNTSTNQTFTVAEGKATNLGKNKAVTLSYKSSDYFPTLPAGKYEVMVCETSNNMERIPHEVQKTFNITVGESAVPYINGRTSVCDKQVVAGDSVDVRLMLGSYNGTFDGYVRINTSSGLTPILRSNYIPVTIAEGEKLQLDVACLCGAKATMGKWTLVIKYFDKNKRELGTLSNNTFTYARNDYFWVGDETAIEEVESVGGATVTVCGSTITITNADDALVTVYSSDGREVYHGTDNIIQVASGLYIVTVQNSATKVFVR